jgi:hypothetical protein
MALFSAQLASSNQNLKLTSCAIANVGGSIHGDGKPLAIFECDKRHEWKREEQEGSGGEEATGVDDTPLLSSCTTAFIVHHCFHRAPFPY